jgi:hypothetical protein
MNFEFQTKDGLKTINLRTKRNGNPPCSLSCIDCSFSYYEYEIYTAKDTINLTYNTQTLLDGRNICGTSWAPDHAKISAPERIDFILNLLYILELGEMVFKSAGEPDKNAVLYNLFEWDRNYK